MIKGDNKKAPCRGASLSLPIPKSYAIFVELAGAVVGAEATAALTEDVTVAFVTLEDVVVTVFCGVIVVTVSVLSFSGQKRIARIMITNKMMIIAGQ